MNRTAPAALVLTTCMFLGACTASREDDSQPVPTGAGPLTETSSGTDSQSGETTDDSQGSQDILDVNVGETDGGPIESAGDVCEENIDIVFVMDVSTTMGPFLATMADEILAVDQAVAALDVQSQPHYGLVVFVDDFALLEAGAAYPDAQSLADDFRMWSSFTSSNNQVSGSGTNSTWPENSIDALYAAASGFQWRPASDTLRIIIHTTDDTFWDGPATQNGVMIQRSYDETVSALQDEEIRVFSFADDIGGSCECEDVTPGWSSEYMGNPSIPTATDGDVFDIAEVLTGNLSLAAAIEDAVVGSACEEYEPVG